MGLDFLSFFRTGSRHWGIRLFRKLRGLADLTPMLGLIPSWTKRKPDHGTLLKTINCRDDSLFENKGMWTSMKHKKRCIVVAQGFYEWKKKGNDKVPPP